MRSEGTSRHFEQVASPKRVIRASPWRRERDWCGRLAELGYRSAAAASQIATHSPSDKSNITIKDAAVLSRGG
jgi:hypothetical protein